MIKDLITIIIPVYNGEKHIKMAIESAISQSYRKLEIIIINDGSIDNTGEIIKKYKIKDNRIIIINKENGGQSSARNIGLLHSKGSYVLFLDSDDNLQRNAVEVAFNEINKYSNIAFCLYGFNVYLDKKLLRTPNSGDSFYRFSYGYNSFKHIDRLLNSPCNKLYSREYINKQFNETLIYAEDSVFNYENLKVEYSIVTIKDCLYNVQLNTQNSVNKRYISGKIENSLFAAKIKEDTMITIFGESFDINKHRIEQLDIYESLLESCVLNMNKKDFIAEINTLMNNSYLKTILRKKNKTKIYIKISLILINCKSWTILVIYLRIINRLRNIKLMFN